LRVDVTIGYLDPELDPRGRESHRVLAGTVGAFWCYWVQIPRIALCASVALCLSACHDREGNSARGHPADSGPTAAVAPVPPLEPIVGTLVGAGWRLSLIFDVRAPTVKLSIHDRPHAVDEVSLVLLHETVDGSVKRRGGAVPDRARRSYRLRFAIDECEGAPPTPPTVWPGRCGYPDGGLRPRDITRYELLVDVDSHYFPSQDVHQIDAACVPASGSGPTCQLHGSGVEAR
jgi:hypothetical protein